MSLHNSLKNNIGLGSKRNVLNRTEKIKALIKAGKFIEGDKVFGLPKVKVVKYKKLKKEKKVEDTLKREGE